MRTQHTCKSFGSCLRLLLATGLFIAPFLIPARVVAEPWSFVLTSDMRSYAGSGAYDTSNYFRGACEAINTIGRGAFMVSPGDIDPPEKVKWTIDNVLGADYLWYPVVGNHEAETASDMEFLRHYDYDPNGSAPPNIVNTGPTGCEKTTYSFDYENAHFVVINEYYDGTSDVGTSGDVVDALLIWLVLDLVATNQEHIFVIGHEPAYPQPDADNGRERHMDDSLNQYLMHRDRFWTVLRAWHVVAYLCAHTHDYSAYERDGVWQLDSGHSRGMGDLGAASTFLIVHVDGPAVWFSAYRDTHDGTYDYLDIVHTGALTDAASSVVDMPPSPRVHLSQNHPNPFNPGTAIEFSLSERCTVTLDVYGVSGRLVRNLFAGEKSAGTHTVSWNGTNNAGQRVPGGTYLYVLESDSFKASRKMIVLK